MKIVLLQLPVPQHNFARRTGNIPLAAACLKSAVRDVPGCSVEILPESQVSYVGDAAILDLLMAKQADVIGFTVFCWNVERTLYLCDRIKEQSQARTILGGPEVTPDNKILEGHPVDLLCFGEGEVLFQQLARGQLTWSERKMHGPVSDVFMVSPSPYQLDYLEPQVDRMMGLETMRGCPYHCLFCNYNKARSHLSFLPPSLIAEAVKCARESGIPEIFFLDPSFEIRPDLGPLLKKIRKLNPNREIMLQGEIRAEAVRPELAQLLAEAGFVEFEIGLQSTDTSVLQGIHRPTNLDRFVSGVRSLQEQGIRARIDLILGLPGDDLTRFRTSVDFLVAHDMHQDVSIFPLSLLPGSELRQRNRELGLNFQDRPPYNVVQTPTFNANQMLEAFCYAEDKFNIVLQPEPDLDLAYRGAGVNNGKVSVPWLNTTFSDSPIYSKIILSEGDTSLGLTALSRRVTQPYQVFFPPGWTDRVKMRRILEHLTAENPHTPLEIIFFERALIEEIEAIDASLHLSRPLYLDLDIPFWGSRSVVYTFVSADRTPCFGGIMKRQVYWWRHEHLPTRDDLASLQHLAGLLLDSPATDEIIRHWQNAFVNIVSDYLLVSFAVIEHQCHWMRLVSADEYWFGESLDGEMDR